MSLKSAPYSNIEKSDKAKAKKQRVLHCTIILKASFTVYKVVKEKAEPETKTEKIK